MQRSHNSGFPAFFWCQALGAYNDNIYKQAVLILIAYQPLRFAIDQPGVMVNLAAGLFILPFMLFAAMAGQIADGMDKTRLIRRVKFAEILLMGAATVALLNDSIWLLLAVLAGLGVQSTFFAPVKYGVIPQLVPASRLMRANGLVNAGTNVAILLGSIIGGALIAIQGAGAWWVAGIGMVAAIVGWGLSLRLPNTEVMAPGTKVQLNPLASLWPTLSELVRQRALFLVALAVSWFWAYGSLWFAQLPNFARDVLSGNERVATLLFAVLVVGIGAGSVLCHRMSRTGVGHYLVALGAVGLTLGGVAVVAFASVLSAVPELTVVAFLSRPASWPVLIALLAMGVAAGFYTVPLYSLCQLRSRAEQRARVFAAVNILNAMFMVLAALLAMLLFRLDWSVSQVLLFTAVANVPVTAGLLWRRGGVTGLG